MRAVNGPSTSLNEANVESPAVCDARTLSAAKARSESNNGNRGLPGGGLTTSGTSWTAARIGAGAYAFAGAQLRASARPHRPRRPRGPRAVRGHARNQDHRAG